MEWRQAIQEVDTGERVRCDGVHPLHARKESFHPPPLSTHTQHADVLCRLRSKIVGGFDEARFGPRIGFAALRRHLEGELARRYREAAPATLGMLQRRCEELEVEVEAAEERMAEANNVAKLRAAGGCPRASGWGGGGREQKDGMGE